MRAIMLTKTEKKIVILLVVVAIVNFLMNILFPFQMGAMEFFLWVLPGILIEILVVCVLILTIRKE